MKGSVYALYFSCRDPRTPWYVRVIATCIVGYAFSPIDLIPDPIPILGLLDDAVLIPLGVALVVKLLPATVWADAQERATTTVRDELGSGWHNYRALDRIRGGWRGAILSLDQRLMTDGH
jgi:uncharacterized membrane protein YkvA (DUF1232 family)